MAPGRAAKLSRLLNQLRAFDITAVEQPVAASDLEGTRRVGQETGLNVIADESLVTLDDAVNLIREQACDVFNVRVSKCGGLISSLRIAELGLEAGVKVQVGAQVGETSLLSAAGRHLAAHLSEVEYVEGSFGTHLLSEDITRDPVMFGYEGRGSLVMGAGLGVEVDDETLERLAVDIMKVEGGGIDMSFVSQLSGLKGRWSWRRFERATRHPEEVQWYLLQRILKSNRDTAYGREHGFSTMRSVEDFQGCVPIADYESFRPWVDKVKSGESGVLTAEEPYMFALTSGTSGQPKSIPVTPATGHMSKRLSRLWLYRCLVDHPKVLDHKALVIVSPAIEGHTESGIPFGSASGNIYKKASWVIRRRYAVPYPVFTIKDFEAKYYAIMRFAIEQRVSLVATPNPSTILRLITTADRYRDRLIKDIHDGALSREFDISEVVREEVKAQLKPNPKRARRWRKWWRTRVR